MAVNAEAQGRGTPRPPTRFAIAVALCLACLAPSVVLAEESSNKPSIGGWAGFAYTDDSRPGSTGGFDSHPFYLYFQAEPVDGFQVFGEFEAEHVFQFKAGSSGSGGFKQARLYLEHEFSKAHTVRAGKFFLPLGYWSRLHWHFLTETLSRPFSFDNASAPRTQVGLEYFGRAFAGDTRLDYYAWLGDGPDEFGTETRTVDAYGAGGSLFVTQTLASPDQTLGGVIGYHEQTATVGSVSEIQQNVVGGVELKDRRFELRSELFRHQRSVGADMKSWYANSLIWVLPRVGINYRFDRGDNLKATRSAADHGAASQSMGLVWRPYAEVLLKGEYRLNRFDDASVSSFENWNAFVAMKF